MPTKATFSNYLFVVRWFFRVVLHSLKIHSATREPLDDISKGLNHLFKERKDYVERSCSSEA